MSALSLPASLACGQQHILTSLAFGQLRAARIALVER